MKKLQLLLAATTIMLMVSCQGPVSPKTDNGNNEETKTFDINKVSFSSTENDNTDFKMINSITIGNNHYFVLFIRDQYQGINIKYDNEIIDGNFHYAQNDEEYVQSYINGTLDLSDIDTVKNYFSNDEIDILGNKVYVFYIKPISYSDIKPYICEQEEDYFLTLSNGEKKVHFDLDLSDNRSYKYFEYYSFNNKKEEKKKIYKKSDVYQPYNAIIDSNRDFTVGYKGTTDGIFGRTNICDVVEPYEYDNEEAFLNNCFTVIGTDLKTSNYYYQKNIDTIIRYAFYYKGSFYNGLKPKFGYDEYSNGKFEKLYFDFELDSIVLYDRFENTFETEVLDYFTMNQDGGGYYGEAEVSKDKIKIELKPDFGLSPFENKVVSLFNMGFTN